MLAAGNNDPAIVATLLKHGADAGLRDDAGRTAVDWAESNPKVRDANVYEKLRQAASG